MSIKLSTKYNTEIYNLYKFFLKPKAEHVTKDLNSLSNTFNTHLNLCSRKQLYLPDTVRSFALKVYRKDGKFCIAIIDVLLIFYHIVKNYKFFFLHLLQQPFDSMFYDVQFTVFMCLYVYFLPEYLIFVKVSYNP